MMLTNKGFTLIEVLVAMTMFAIASLGFVSLMTGTMRANFLAARISEATTLNRDKIEEIRSGGACTAGGSGQYSWTCATAAGPAAGTTVVTVSTTWTGNYTPVVLKTIIAN